MYISTPGYTGKHCELRTCPGKDVPCSGRGWCGQSFDCVCDLGWSSKDCSIPKCRYDCHGSVQKTIVINYLISYSRHNKTVVAKYSTYIHRPLTAINHYNSFGICEPIILPKCKCRPPYFGLFCQYVCHNGNISADSLSLFNSYIINIKPPP